MRDLHSSPLVAYVVVGDGKKSGYVKSVRYASNMSNSVFSAQWATDGMGRRVRCKSIHMDADLSQRGWFFLKEAYEEEGGLEDYETFKGFMSACDSGQVKAPSSKDKSPVPGFPAELLPKKVLDLHAKSAPLGGYWEAPKPKKAAKRIDG